MILRRLQELAASRRLAFALQKYGVAAPPVIYKSGYRFTAVANFGQQTDRIFVFIINTKGLQYSPQGTFCC